MSELYEQACAWHVRIIWTSIC